MKPYIRRIPYFGSPQTGIAYVPRPSAYAIFEDVSQQIGIVKHKRAFFLPGDGIEAGETPVEALQRELIEEIGYQLRKMGKLFEAVEYLQGAPDEAYYQIHSTFSWRSLKPKSSHLLNPITN